jgi:hypothetical protein
MIKRATIIGTITIVNVIVFFYTGVDKILAYNIFKEQLHNSPILSAVAKPIALFLPCIELVIVRFLAITRWRLIGLFASLCIMSIFTVYIIALFLISPELPCSCGGMINSISWGQHTAFNCVFILLTFWAIQLSKRDRKEAIESFDRARMNRLATLKQHFS